MTADIITVGDEILIGQIIDTNSAFIAQRLNEIGIEIGRITSVSDRREEIKACLREASQRAGLIVTTGGLGPTEDDRTKTAIREYFGSGVRFDEEVFSHIKALLGRRGVTLNERNREQAMVPDNCKLIANRLGTAPGMWFEKEGVIYLFMPGVPFEMKSIIEEILPELKNRFAGSVIMHRTILTHGIPESMLARSIESWEQNLPSQLSLAYLPSLGMVRLRITGKGTSNDSLCSIINEQVDKLNKIIPEYIFGYDDDSLEKEVGRLLLKSNAHLSVAESCTGGTISSIITAVPGSSRYFYGGIIAYSNEIKTGVLGIDPSLIQQFGAVSKEVVEAMAAGVKRVMCTEYSIATSGIAGPDGGTPGKPIGTIWIATSSPLAIFSQKFLFGDDRGRNITRSSYAGLNMLRKMLIADTSEIEHD